MRSLIDLVGPARVASVPTHRSSPSIPATSSIASTSRTPSRPRTWRRSVPPARIETSAFPTHREEQHERPVDRARWSAAMRMISVDDHVVEPPDVWTSRLPAKWQDQCPRGSRRTARSCGASRRRRSRSPSSVAACSTPPRTSAISSTSRSAMRTSGPVATNRPSASAISTRRDRRVALLPRLPPLLRTGVHRGDGSRARVGVRARVQRLDDRRVGGAVPGRLIPLVIMPLWDADLAVAEVERCAAKGARAVTFSENPAALGLPSVHDRRQYWDPVFAAWRRGHAGLHPHRVVVEAAAHVGRRPAARRGHAAVEPGRGRAGGLALQRPVRAPPRTPPLPLGRRDRMDPGDPRTGRLRVRALRAAPEDGHRLRPTGMGSVDTGEFSFGSVDVRPSELFRDHVFGCFIDDRHGAA